MTVLIGTILICQALTKLSMGRLQGAQWVWMQNNVGNAVLQTINIVATLIPGTKAIVRRGFWLVLIKTLQPNIQLRRHSKSIKTTPQIRYRHAELAINAQQLLTIFQKTQRVREMLKVVT